MERRSEERVRQRISCEFDWRDRRYKGIVLDLSPVGLFVQMEATSVPAPGSQITLRLLGSNRFPEVEVECSVARRQLVSTMLGSVTRRGVGLRILEAPDEYFQALGARPRFGWQESPTQDDGIGSAAQAGVEIEIEVGSDATEPAPYVPRPAPDDPPGQPGQPERVAAPDEGEAEDDPDLARAVGAPPRGPAPVAAPPAHAEPGTPEPAEGPAHAETDLAPHDVAGEPPSAAPVRSLRPLSAIVVDEAGELADVYDLLEELGAKPVRARLSGPTRFQGWARPPRLLVVAAKAALEIERPEEADSQGVVTIAVAEGESHTLCTLMQRLGYHFVVRRPVHPEALRLLLLRALYRDLEHRGDSRLPAGHAVTWWHGWRLHAGALLDISRGGYRMETSAWVPLGSDVSLRIPRGFTGSRSLALPGTVVRRHVRDGSLERPIVLAVAFPELPRELAKRLEELLAYRSIGPASMSTRKSWWPELVDAISARLPRRWRSLPEAPPRAPEPPPEPPPAPAPEERRAMPRGVLGREIVALDEAALQVQTVLMGRDLSRHGVRVEPHPMLEVGDPQRIAFYDEAFAGPLVLEAEVARDDGEEGMWLRFTALDEEQCASVDRMVERLPALTDAPASEETAGGVVMGRLLPADRPPVRD